MKHTFRARTLLFGNRIESSKPRISCAERGRSGNSRDIWIATGLLYWELAAALISISLVNRAPLQSARNRTPTRSYANSDSPDSQRTPGCAKRIVSPCLLMSCPLFFVATSLKMAQRAYESSAPTSE